MINPYAHTFLIATRNETALRRPHSRAEPSPKPVPRLPWFWRK